MIWIPQSLFRKNFLNSDLLQWMATLQKEQRFFQPDQKQRQADDDVDAADQYAAQVGNGLPEDHQLKKTEEEEDRQDITAGQEKIFPEFSKKMHASLPKN